MGYSVNPTGATLGSTNKKQAKVINKTIKTVRKAAEVAALLAAPNVAGKIKGAKVVKEAVETIAKKKPYVKVTTGTQAKNANITLKTPKAKKAGSPQPGTKAKIQRVVNPRQGAAGQAAAAGNRAAKKVVLKTGKAAGFAAGVVAEKAYQDSKKPSPKKK